MGTLIKVFILFVLLIGIVLFIYVFVLKKKIDKNEIKYQLEEFKKSRALVGSLCLIIAFILCFVITPAFTTALNNKVIVIESTRDIKIGEKITENMIREIEIGSYGVSPNILKSKDDIKDKYATKEIPKGQYLYKNQVSDILPYENEYLYTNLTGMNRAISFTVNKLSNGLSNKLKQGDIISIIVINSNSKIEDEKAIIPEELKYVEVLTTTNDTGEDIENVDKTKNIDDNMYQTITVLVCDEQAKVIANAETTKQIYVELVYRQGNQNVASYLLRKQRDILDEKYPDRINKEDEKIIKKLLENNDESLDGETINPLDEINKTLEEAINNARKETEETTNNGYEEYAEETIKDETVEEIIEETTKEVKETRNIEEEEYNRIKAEYNTN